MHPRVVVEAVTVSAGRKGRHPRFAQWGAASCPLR